MKIQRYVHLYQGTTVVFDRKDIKNAKDEDFEQLSMYLDIKELINILKQCYSAGDELQKNIIDELLSE